jgi:mannobiose 2-epimerase
MVGFFNAWQMTKAKHFLDKSLASWEFTKKNLIDKENGEWFISAHNKNGDKVTLWKCPYHNSRACIEIFNRIKHKH